MLATTTTRVAMYEVEQAPFSAPLKVGTPPSQIRDWLNEHGFVFLYGTREASHHKIAGLHPEVLAGIVDSVNSDVLLIEADGARRLPLKAPRDHEPVIPPDTSLVVPVAGIDALGQPLDEEHVFNAARICERYGFPEGGAILPPWMAVVLRDAELGLRAVPETARVIALLNKVSLDRYERDRARRVAQLILRSPESMRSSWAPCRCPIAVHERSARGRDRAGGGRIDADGTLQTAAAVGWAHRD